MNESNSMPLELSAHMVRGEPISYAEAVTREFEPIEVGRRWGPPWSTTWFHVTGRVPVSWTGKGVVAVFDLGFAASTGFTCEALAWKDGRPWRGVDPNHRWLPIDGDEVDLYLEAAANPVTWFSGSEPSPSMIALRTSPEPAFTLERAELKVQDDGERELELDRKVRAELAEALPAVKASAEIRNHHVHAVGHAHIDTAWLWPLREARRKCARTFSTQLALMDEYPDYRFACSQPVHYQWMKDSYPTIFEGIRRKIEAGQWEPVGSMWVEPDCNLPSGEALVRQILFGKGFFMKEFGYETHEVWLPDVFGYPASLPQLFALSGATSFLTQKLSWNDTNKPAHHTFLWEGIDGTQVFTHFPPADTYNGDFSAGEVVRSAARFHDHARSSHSLYLFGWGDGGGGPEPDMIESARRLRNLGDGPRVELSRAKDFFSEASAEAHDLTTWVGELYFELHRGTYTSQARTKRLNRRAEQALREAEMWSVAAGTDYPAADLEAAWKTLLVNQFHDILPGSSIDWVYEEAERDLAGVIATAEEITAGKQVGLAGDGEQLVAFNVNSHARREVVEVDGGAPRMVEAPACGWAAQLPEAAPAREVSVSAGLMENDLLAVRWDEHGLLTSVWDKQARREVLAAGARGNLLQLHDDNPARWDAWDIDMAYMDSRTDVTELASQQVEMAGGLRGAVRFERRFSASSMTQRMVLDAGSRVLRFECDVEWREDHKLLKVAFPVSVRSPQATYEIQFGHVQRPTHANTPWDQARFEVCGHRWADLGEAGYGVALLNDCKYGYDIRGSVMRLSLLRSPTHPDPNADRGRQQFTYALMPHAGDFREAGVIPAAEDLNAPLRLVRGGLGPGQRRSLIVADSPQVVIESVKCAEDSEAIVIRLYEAWGGRCTVRLTTTLPARLAAVCDLLEREVGVVAVRDGRIDLELGPFKIVTLKLVP